MPTVTQIDYSSTIDQKHILITYFDGKSKKFTANYTKIYSTPNNHLPTVYLVAHRLDDVQDLLVRNQFVPAAHRLGNVAALD